jgi:solute carrier family 13 (sodium-dependent dicarboxylate transporter), member 2/3/5
MSTAEAKLAEIPKPGTRVLDHLRLLKAAAAFGIPVLIWLAPLPIAPAMHAAIAISAFMIIAWMTELMEYAVSGLIGLMLFWVFQIAEPAVIFSGFINDTSWFLLGAMLIGTMAAKSGLPQRIANFVISRIGVTYSRVVLGLIVIDLLLTFVVPSGAAVLVIMASLALAVMKLFDAKKGSNIGRGLFVVLTYVTGIFNKMIIAGSASIMARGMIERAGVNVSYAGWFLAFLPTVLVTVAAAWWFTLKAFPPEAASLTDRSEQVKAHFQKTERWTPLSVKSGLLCGLALVLWLTDELHHISPAMIAFAIGLFGLLPFIDVLDEKDVRGINLLPFFFTSAALGMGEVLESTGALRIVTDTFIGGLEPWLAERSLATAVLYWGGFFYHFVTASELSMLATSMPVLMEFARTNGLDPLFVGLIWAFASGGKLFAYQSAVLVLGYAYGYFRHTDLIKTGLFLTLVDFIVLWLSVVFYWPLLGL